MKKLIPLLLLPLIVSGCSTFLNPFRKDKTEDYNALTYGDDYKDRGGDWAPSRVRIAREDLGGSSEYNGLASDGRKIATASPYEDERVEGKLDASDARVRDKISVSRGQAVAAYKRGDRATKEDFWDQAPNDGSLWSNEQDANYFFTKGKVRGMGDIVSIKVEDPLVKQVAEEIKKNLTPSEQEVEMALYIKNNPSAKDDKDIENFRAVASDDLGGTAADTKDRMQKAARWSQVDLTKVIGLAPNEEVRAEVIDKYPNGNFKVKAVRRVLYRGTSKLVALVGVAPSADFDDKDTIASGKLYEYKLRVSR